MCLKKQYYSVGMCNSHILQLFIPMLSYAQSVHLQGCL